jgi:hypothetical protein
MQQQISFPRQEAHESCVACDRPQKRDEDELTTDDGGRNIVPRRSLD